MEFFTKKNFHFRQSPIILYAIIAIITLLLILNLDVNNAFAKDNNGREYFKDGKDDFEAGRYAEAVKNLLIAEKEFCLLGDYALFYMSEAYQKMGEHGKSLDSIRRLLENYPLSPLRKKARMSEIREAKENTKENLLQLFESYIKDYPEDEDMNFMYGIYLKKSGEMSKARSIFKQIYLRAGALSNSAYDKSEQMDISSADLIERASNLIKRYGFKEAENDLRKAMLMDDGRNRDEILKNLGFSLYRQKKYKEAAEIYDKADDTYFKARSLFRAGDKQGFDLALNELLAMNNKRAGYLLVADASDKRRDKDYKNALKIYNNVLINYPSESEEAMWGIGWTYYVSGEYKKSADIFSKLSSKYEDPKYLYWQAKSVEAIGDNATDLYNSLMQMDNNFYGVLSYAKNKGKIPGSVSDKNTLTDVSYDKSESFERVDALQSLDMSKEAAIELISLSKRIDSHAELIYIISKFHELGEFKRALGLVKRIPYSEKLHRFWYPLAFRNIVEQISEKYNIDPLIVLSVIREESRFDADAKSVAGARGLMQIMPQTAYRLDKSLKIGINNPSHINNMENNIHLGIYYLKFLFNEFNSLAHVLAAYNAGEMVVSKWEECGNYRSVDEFIEDIPYPETRNYVKKVITSYFQYKKFLPVNIEEADLNIIPGKL